MSDIFDIQTIDELQALTGYFVRVVAVADEELNEALNHYYGTGGIIPAHRPLDQQEIDSLAKKVAGADSSIIIYGERCPCKELLAWSIHSLSTRSGRPFIKLNCAGMTETQLEGELFGYEKSSFKKLFNRDRSKLELASRGTLFLEEIGDMPLSIQAKVLRILQTGEFEKVGSIKTRRTDVRIIATTSKDLHQAVKEETFNKDLYFGLNVIPIELPPLRERKADIPLWTELLLKEIGKQVNKPGLSISEDALQTLMEYHWPGNLMELESCLERAAIVAEGELITRDCLSIPLDNLQEKKALHSEKCVIEKLLRNTEGKSIWDIIEKTAGPQVLYHTVQDPSK